jgi:hypothetical protein
MEMNNVMLSENLQCILFLNQRLNAAVGSNQDHTAIVARSERQLSEESLQPNLRRLIKVRHVDQEHLADGGTQEVFDVRSLRDTHLNHYCC